MSNTAQSTATLAPAGAPAQRATGQLSHGQILTILTGLLLGMFLAALDQTIVSSAIRTIADDLHGLDQQAWATTAYLITSTVTTPLYGKLSDLWGRRPLFLTAISLFVIGSLACTFSQSMYQLAGFRAFQGLGAGGLMSLAFAIIGDIVPPRERSRYQGYFMAVFATSSVLGPVIGGFFAGQSELIGVAGWRWVFLVNVPIGIVALLVVGRVLHIPHTRRNHRIDFLGAITIAIGVVPLLIVAEQGRAWGWGSGKSLACFIIGGVGLIAFYFAERWMKDDALIPLRLFRNSVFSLTSSGGFFIGVAMFGAIAMVPQYLQIVKGASPTKAGLLMLPLMGGIMLASLASGQITARTGRYKLFPLIGSVLMTGGLLLFHQVKWDTPLWQTDIYMAIVGLGLGLCMQTITLAVQNAVPPRDMGVASSSSMFFRQMGGTLGTAVFLSLLFSTVGDKITEAFRTVAGTPDFQAALRDPAVLADKANAPVLALVHGGGGGGTAGVLQDSSFIQHLDPRLAVPFQMGFSNSMDLVFLVTAIAPVAAFLLLLFMKEIPLRTQSGMAALAAEEAGSAAPVVEDPAAPGAPEGALAVGNGHEHSNGHGHSNGHANGNGRHALAGEGNLSQILRSPELQPGAELMTNGSSAPQQGETNRITGRVLRGNGSPIKGAALTLIDLGGHQVARAVSDDSGVYGVPVASAGTYVLIASAGTHHPQASTITANGGSIEVNLVLAGRTRLFGTITVADTGAPVPDATVTLTDERGEVIMAGVTGADGGYSLEGLSGGMFTMVVSAARHRPVATAVTVPQGGEEQFDLELVGGGRLSGIARSGNGQPVRDALITFVDGSGTVLMTTTTDADGAYTLEDLPSGEYTIIASGYPAVASAVRVEPGAQGQHDVELRYPDA
ncbi:MFS transporter [Actinopolymorpha pittospori]|uniref:EmrB/QacA subfamily drug resistance transporter n=1 Tax=Actinopolymorpha pittospori TaxID=648752 RepID=A0A927MWY5_9ACTN|nr:MFS transporter [Actinopolymorpha pittospori]MBE1606283.1 EmrB/QacA subfamily drug resistance transporter [Actinopolymorpha pittospori]